MTIIMRHSSITVYGRFREMVTLGQNMKCSWLLVISNHSKSKESKFSDAEEFVLISFIVFEIQRDEVGR